MKPTSNDTTTVRLPRELVDAVRVIAAAHDRSISAELRVALDEYAARKLPEVARLLEQRDTLPNRTVLEAVAKANKLLNDPTIRLALEARTKANRVLGRQGGGA